MTEKLAKVDFEGLSTNANGLVVGLKTTASKLDSAISQVQETLKGMKLDTVAQNGNELVTGLRETNLRLQRVLDQVGAAPIPQLVGELEQTLASLNGVLIELKRYPSGFFLGDPPIPARSVETPAK